MNNRLIIYADGSFKDEKGAWCYSYSYNREIDEPDTVLGACYAMNSTQAEIIACIKAIEKIDLDQDIDCIEIHTDFLELVKVMNQVIRYDYTNLSSILNKLGTQNTTLAYNLAQLVIQCVYNIKFYKVSKNNKHNKKVHILAKHALYSFSVNEEYSYIWSETDNKFILFGEAAN